ncbi:MAG TPA: glutamine synthetase family protein [Actinomycetota bacterium]|jgi:glutamine synthetase|nr:glutamine synthetase family protein [Actinomycetota bacterium]
MVEAERDFVLNAAEERDIRFVQLWFTDVLGQLKAFAIPAEELPEALAEGASFDGASIEGFSRVDEADMIAMPVPRTFQSLPWRPEKAGVARMFCDVLTADGEPFEGDPRRVLKQAMARVRDLGFTAYVGGELDFFLLAGPDDPTPVDTGSYFDLTPLDSANDFRRSVLMYLEALGIPVKDSHHEDAASQHGVDLRHADALTIADSLMSFRLVVKEVAREFDQYATFMPKPIEGVQGSGLHTHLSLFEGERNAFFDPTDEYHLSKVGRSFMAGLLGHAREITAITNQWVNSYKRLVPGFEAPTHVSWGARNRSALVRVPVTKRGKESSCRIEYRAPDPACNPYLTLAVILGAGVEGIRGEYELPVEAGPDLAADAIAGRDVGMAPLPDTLSEALQAMRHSALVRGVLGDHLFEWFLANKDAEWSEHKAHVSGLEIERYLPRL